MLVQCMVVFSLPQSGGTAVSLTLLSLCVLAVVFVVADIFLRMADESLVNICVLVLSAGVVGESVVADIRFMFGRVAHVDESLGPIGLPVVQFSLSITAW